MNTRLHPSEYAEAIWAFVKNNPGEQALTIANGLGMNYSTIAHVLTQMTNDLQLKRKKIQVASQEVGKHPVSPFHYQVVGTTFVPTAKASKAPRPPVPAAPQQSPNARSVREALMLKISADKPAADPLELVQHLNVTDLKALRDALNELFV